jgi:DNA-binding NtrC family response regulator
VRLVPVKLRLLVIDHDPHVLESCSKAFAESDLEVLTATTEVQGLEIFVRRRPQIVILNLSTPQEGIDCLARFISVDPAVSIILLADQYTTSAAVHAIRLGATDYLEKPIDFSKLKDRVTDLLRDAEHRGDALLLERELVESYQFEGIIGRSPNMLEVFSRIRRVSPHFRVLLINGNTGTGKELVARALHAHSPVSKGPFVACNCSAFVETLLETELFGYVKGAFTGADRDKAGLFEYASGGTVFLDEIGEMPIGAQAKLLRVLQDKEIQRVGSPKVHAVDCHVIAATNRDLKAMIAHGQFREDLYYRLAIVEIALPPLSQRMEDLPLLERYFLEKHAKRYKKNILGLTRRAQARLSAYPWPGNVRELENVIANACMMIEAPLIDIKDLPDSITRTQLRDTSPTGVPATLEAVQENHLLNVLAYTSGNKARAAEILDISRETIYSMLARIARRSRVQTQGVVQRMPEQQKSRVAKLERSKQGKM